LRPKEFDAQKDRCLESELKYLYVAITRARRNLWIFDQNEQKRAPIFELLRRCNLARLVQGMEGSEQSFTVTSTPEEWKKSGDYFYKVSKC
jgi:superfamily I DNA/RNA helicase